MLMLVVSLLSFLSRHHSFDPQISGAKNPTKAPRDLDKSDARFSGSVVSVPLVEDRASEDSPTRSRRKSEKKVKVARPSGPSGSSGGGRSIRTPRGGRLQ